MSESGTNFDYRPSLWHPQCMEQARCRHTLSHVDDDGFLSGSWSTEKTDDGTRLVCESCGKFYGYLAALKSPPLRRPETPRLSATVRTAVALICGERRVFFEIPATGFGLHELDALKVAIECARRELLGSYGASEPELPPEPCG